MLKVLVNAYAVSPNWGSEPGMGWNWVSNLAKHCDMYVITEGEWQNEIEEVIAEAKMNGLDASGHLTREQAERLHFYYNPLPDEVRKMCWNQGDWRFYYYYKKWQEKTLEICREIMKSVDIDLLHQLNMIGYREPGMMWKIDEKPFVWGPFGGCELMPMAYLEGVGLKTKAMTWLKNKINSWQIRHASRVLKAIKRADGLCNATKGVNDVVKALYRPDAVLLNETGCYVKEAAVQSQAEKEGFDLMWVGKFDFRKQLGIALNTMALLKDLGGMKLHICGDGSEAENACYHTMCEQLDINDMVVWHGKVPNAQVQQMMSESDLLLFTSIMEGTPHVVMEALGNNLPTICIDTCGQGDCVDEKSGLKVKLSNPRQTADDMAVAIRDMYLHREKLDSLKKHCHERQLELSWDARIEVMLGVYDKAIERFNNRKK